MNKIELPENYIFSNKLDVRVDDVNNGNHLDFSRLVAMLGNTRSLFFKENNYPELSKNNIGITTRNLRVSYMKEALFGDSLIFSMGITRMKGATVVLSCRVQVNNVNPVDIAHGEITLVFIDYGSQRPRPVPEDFITMVNNCKNI